MTSDSPPTKAVDLVAAFDAAYELEWERVAEHDGSGASGEADRMATLAGIRAVLALYAQPSEPAADDGLVWRARVAHIEAWTENEAWSFLRNVLAQGMAIQMDAAAGKYQRSEEVSIRLDGAARERRDQMQAALAAPTAETKVARDE